MLEDKSPVPPPKITELARKYAEGEFVKADFIGEMEKAVQGRERMAFYKGVIACLLFLLLMVILVKIFPGIIAQKY